MKTHGHSVLPFFAIPSAEDEKVGPMDLLSAKTAAGESFSSIMQRTGKEAQNFSTEEIIETRAKEIEPTQKSIPVSTEMVAATELSVRTLESSIVPKPIENSSASEKPLKFPTKNSPSSKPSATEKNQTPAAVKPISLLATQPLSSQQKKTSEAIISTSQKEVLPLAGQQKMPMAKNAAKAAPSSEAPQPRKDSAPLNRDVIAPVKTNPLTSGDDAGILSIAVALENASISSPNGATSLLTTTPKLKSVSLKKIDSSDSSQTSNPLAQRQTAQNIPVAPVEPDSEEKAPPVLDPVFEQAKKDTSSTAAENKTEPKLIQPSSAQDGEKSAMVEKIATAPDAAALDSQATADSALPASVTVIKAHGTVGALNGRRMKPTLEMDEVAENKVEPSPHAMATAASANKSSSDPDSSFSSNSSSPKAETGDDFLTSELAAKSNWAAPAEKGQGQTIPVATSASQVERVGLFVNQHVISLRQSGAATLSVSLKLDAQTELNLHLTTHKGQVEASVQWNGSSNPGLETHWKDLQQSLARQNVQLLPFDAKPAARTFSGNATSASSPAIFDQNSPSRQRRQHETQADGVETFFVSNSNVVKQTSSHTFSGQGWESWA